MVEPDRPDPRPVVAVELVVASVVGDPDDAAALRPYLPQGLYQQAVVDPVVGGLHEHHALDSEHVGHPQVKLERGVRKGVQRVGDVQKARLEDVKVSVARAAGHREARDDLPVGHNVDALAEAGQEGEVVLDSGAQMPRQCSDRIVPASRSASAGLILAADSSIRTSTGSSHRTYASSTSLRCP